MGFGIGLGPFRISSSGVRVGGGIGPFYGSTRLVDTRGVGRAPLTNGTVHEAVLVFAFVALITAGLLSHGLSLLSFIGVLVTVRTGWGVQRAVQARRQRLSAR